MINLPLFIDFEIPLPFTESEEGPLLLLINQGLLGIIMIVFSFLFLLLGVAIANKIVADRVPHIHPTTGIGGSIISPIPDVKSARFVEEGNAGAIQVELNEDASRFHIYLYQIGLRNGKPVCKYRRRLLIVPKEGDARHYTVIKDKKVNAFAIDEDPVKGHLHISIAALIFAPIIMSFFAFSAIYSAVWGTFFFLQDYADSTGQYFVYGLEAPFERPDSVQLLLIGTALIFVATFLIVFATAHEGRRKN